MLDLSDSAFRSSSAGGRGGHVAATSVWACSHEWPWDATAAGVFPWNHGRPWEICCCFYRESPVSLVDATGFTTIMIGRTWWFVVVNPMPVVPTILDGQYQTMVKWGLDFYCVSHIKSDHWESSPGATFHPHGILKPVEYSANSKWDSIAVGIIKHGW